MELARRKFLISTVAAGTTLAIGTVWSVEQKDERAWKDIRHYLFKDRPVRDGAGVISLDVPARPANGGDVTVKILSSYPQNGTEFITDHYLVVDKNPSPIAAHFSLSPQTSASIGTRIRVNEYSTVRAIAQTNKGELYMSTVFVKASGGCSAPPMGDDAMAKLMMGKTSLTQEKPVAPGNAYSFHLSIMHPNYSGLQKDQITTYFIPPHYIETVEVKNEVGDVIFAVKGDISFSENPSFDFAYMPTDKTQALSVQVVDSRKKIFASQWPLTQS